MLPNNTSDRPTRGWGRCAARTFTAIVLFAVPLGALAFLGPGLVPAAADSIAAAAPLSTNPLTFDAPAQTVAQTAAQQRDAARQAARLSLEKQEEATVLDDWHYTTGIHLGGLGSLSHSYVPPPLPQREGPAGY